ncbi:hypothetical protein P43SY_007669 [Pythium insidiosum]|uniref:Cysteine protease n=1 Tax=Pythium insidiosum TaxID=114742 RepID=A0AAD5LNT5_PYTIN|nr:hypothetical protein P43SY_007669 [Pythium insidiosum]
MSHLAHGISALDLSSSSSSSSPVWLLGRLVPHEDLPTAFDALLWLTYRRDFAPLEPYALTSDAGWGCMLRSAQMLLAQALQRLELGRDWRKDDHCGAYTRLLSWFVDAPRPECRFGLHHLVQLGLQYDKLPGEWYGPTTAAQVLRDLVNRQSREAGGRLVMYVPQEGVVYSDDVQRLVVSHLDEADDETPIETTAAVAVASDSSPAFFDPLLNPPQDEAVKEWSRALLVLLPLRLGLDSLNESYVPALEKTFTFPQSVGIIGGKKGHSVYFVGTHEQSLLLMDPHDVQPAAELNASFPTATHLRTMHPPHPLIMNAQSIDPSMALGFLCENRREYLDFCHRVRALQAECGGLCPFSVADRRPDYAVGEMDLMLNDCALSGDSMHEGETDEDDSRRLNGHRSSVEQDDEDDYPRTEHLLPPPWDQHTPLDLARFPQSGTRHLTEPPASQAPGSTLSQGLALRRIAVPCFQQRLACLARLVHPSTAQNLLLLAAGRASLADGGGRATWVLLAGAASPDRDRDPDPDARRGRAGVGAGAGELVRGEADAKKRALRAARGGVSTLRMNASEPLSSMGKKAGLGRVSRRARRRAVRLG